MNELKAGYRVLVDATITNVDIEHGQYYVRVADHGIWMKEDKVHLIDTPTKTYEDGLREAWETARLIELVKEDGGLADNDLTGIFGTGVTPFIFRDNTAQEAAAKIAEWKSKEEIHVGDVLKNKITGKEVVVSCVKSRNEKNAFAIYPDGSCGEFEKSEFIKTGRTIDIAGLLAQIGGVE